LRCVECPFFCNSCKWIKLKPLHRVMTTCNAKNHVLNF
jgi:hypothetical protein